MSPMLPRILPSLYSHRSLDWGRPLTRGSRPQIAVLTIGNWLRSQAVSGGPEALHKQRVLISDKEAWRGEGGAPWPPRHGRESCPWTGGRGAASGCCSSPHPAALRPTSLPVALLSPAASLHECRHPVSLLELDGTPVIARVAFIVSASTRALTSSGSPSPHSQGLVVAIWGDTRVFVFACMISNLLVLIQVALTHIPVPESPWN